MKKHLSLMLAFVLVLGLFTPFAEVNATEGTEVESAEQLFNTMLEKFGSMKGKAIEALLVIQALDNEDGLMESIKSELDKESNKEAKAILLNNGFTDEKIAEVLGVLREQFTVSADEINGDEATGNVFVKILTATDPTYSEYKDGLKEVHNAIYNVLPIEIKEDLARYADTKEGKKAFLLKFANVFMDAKLGEGTYEEHSNEDLDTWSLDLKVPTNFLEDANKILETPLTGETKIELTKDHKDSIEALLNVIETQVNAVGENKRVYNLLKDADLIVATENYTNDNSGSGSTGGSGGGSSSSEPEAPVVTVPEDEAEEQVAVVEIAEDAVEVEVTEETVVAEVAEDAIEDAIEALEEALEEVEEALEEAMEQVLEIVIPDTEGKKEVTVSLPSDAMAKLTESEVDLVVNAGAVEFTIPANALDLSEIAEGSTIDLKFDLLAETETVKVQNVVETVKANENADKQEMFKVLDFTMNVVDKDGEVTAMTTFKKSIKLTVDVKDVDVANYDKLGVYYINEEDGTMEFVGGKIKDGKLEVRTSHFSKYAVLSVDVNFADLDNHWSEEYVESMAAKNVIKGYPTGDFKPENSITRAEFAKMVVLATELDLVDYVEGFSDVNNNDWYAKFVATAAKAGIVNGYPDKTFKPDANISRLEMAAFLARSLKTGELSEAECAEVLAKFNDASSVQTWGVDEAAQTVKEGLLIGSEGNFNPNGTATRAEAATSVYRLYNK